MGFLGTGASGLGSALAGGGEAAAGAAAGGGSSLLGGLTSLGSVAGGVGQLTSALRAQSQVPVTGAPQSNSAFPQAPSASQVLSGINPQPPQYPSLAASTGTVQAPDYNSLLATLAALGQRKS